MRAYRWTSLAVAVIVSAVLVAPAHAQDGVEIKPPAKVKRDKYFILPDEIAEKPDLTNAYDVVKVLRSQWLKLTRGSGGALGSSDFTPQSHDVPKGCPVHDPPPGCGSTSSGGGGPVPSEHGSPYADNTSTVATPGAAGPVLYVNDVKQESLAELKNIRAADVAEIHYLTGNIAAGRYGAGHENGAILVKTVMFNKP